MDCTCNSNTQFCQYFEILKQLSCANAVTKKSSYRLSVSLRVHQERMTSILRPSTWWLLEHRTSFNDMKLRLLNRLTYIRFSSLHIRIFSIIQTVKSCWSDLPYISKQISASRFNITSPSGFINYFPTISNG